GLVAARPAARHRRPPRRLHRLYGIRRRRDQRSGHATGQRRASAPRLPARERDSLLGQVAQHGVPRLPGVGPNTEGSIRPLASSIEQMTVLRTARLAEARLEVSDQRTGAIRVAIFTELG